MKTTHVAAIKFSISSALIGYATLCLFLTSSCLQVFGLNNSVIGGANGAVAMTVAGEASHIAKSFIVSASPGDTLRLQLTATASGSAQLGSSASTYKPGASMTIIRIQ